MSERLYRESSQLDYRRTVDTRAAWVRWLTPHSWQLACGMLLEDPLKPDRAHAVARNFADRLIGRVQARGGSVIYAYGFRQFEGTVPRIEFLIGAPRRYHLPRVLVDASWRACGQIYVEIEKITNQRAALQRFLCATHRDGREPFFSEVDSIPPSAR